MELRMNLFVGSKDAGFQHYGRDVKFLYRGNQHYGRDVKIQCRGNQHCGRDVKIQCREI